jgi:hypothetical protein
LPQNSLTVNQLKLLKFILRLFWRLVKTLLIGLACILLFPLLLYIAPARYDFPEPKPFQGDKWFNPYRDMDSTHWLHANFHMHSRAWGGLTNGSENKDHYVYDTYRKAGFESLSISNYQTINKLYSDDSSYIPAYEHGYGMYKNHHLCLGAKRVVWFDLPYGQNIHHKQFILNKLRPTTEIISVNHPSFFKGFRPEDFRKLTGYDFIEVLNGFRNSVPHWDSALSAGRPALILANDDMHDISNPDEIGRRFTVVNSPSNARRKIIAALKGGNAFGVYYRGEKGETLHDKTGRFARLPVMKSFTVANDTLTVELDTTAFEFRFFGQHGKLLKKIGGTRKTFYVLKPEDNYVRTVILFSTKDNPEGLQFFLNPVMRSNDGNKPAMPQATVNRTITALARIGLTLFILVVAISFIRLMQVRKKK